MQKPPLSKGKNSEMITTYSLPEPHHIQSWLLEYIEAHHSSSPNPVNDIATFSNPRVTLCPLYTINYDIDATFTTSTKRVIHQEKHKNATLCIDGRTGEEFPNAIYRNYSNTPTLTYSPELNNMWSPVIPSVISNLDKIITEIIIDRHSRTITYVGRNNRIYSKPCIPSKRSFKIYDVALTYLPVMSMNLSIKLASYAIPDIYYTQSKLFFSSTLNKCSICGRHVDHGYICNECGSIVHKETLLDSHGFTCRQCGKTLCRTCTCAVGFHKYACEECAKCSNKPYKHVSPTMREKNLARIGTLFLALLISFITPISFEVKIIIIGVVISVTLLFLLSEISPSKFYADKLNEINLNNYN